MLIVPHGAPAGYEWVVAIIVLVGLYFAVRNLMRAQRKFSRKPPVLLPLGGLEPDCPARSAEERASKPPSDFSRLCESTTGLPPKEQPRRVRDHFGILGGVSPAERRGRKGGRQRAK